MTRRLAALVLGAVYVIGVVYGTFVLVLRPPPPPAVPLPPARPALSEHVLFVVVDGLRYDVATDPERMPHFADAMQRHRSADIIAGRISMTSAAVQNYGTGQRGRFAQIVRNINPDPPPYNSWLQNAADRGRVLALAGDPVWVEMFGKSFREQRLDPEGVAMDYDFNDRTFRSARELLGKQPHLLVVHFVTPDHQGHVYGIPSARYGRHIHGFDQQLFQLLSEVPRDWTVVVTSDHGAADSGTHGADVAIQRRSPLFAYGPGIAEKGEPETLDQSDLAGTLAALLGVPAAAHSQGHVLSGWLAVPPAEQAAYGCADAARAVALLRGAAAERAQPFEARLKRVCDAPLAPEARRRGAADLVRDIDALLTSLQDFSSWQSWAFLGGTLVGACIVGWLAVGQSLAAAGLCAGLGLLGIALVAGLERLPGYWPKNLDATLFVLFNLPSLLFLVRPEKLISLLSARRLLAAAIVPGGFTVAYPTNLQPVAYSICLAACLVIALARSPEHWGLWWDRAGTARRARELSLVVVWGLALAPAGIYASGAYTSFVQREQLTLGLALGLTATVAYALVRRAPRAGQAFLTCVALATASLLLRRVAPPWLGRPLLLSLPLVGAWLLRQRRFEAGFWLIFLGFVWVSRDFELLPLGAGLGMTLLLGARFRGISQPGWSRARWLIAVGVLFCVMFLVRLGISMGLDALSLDFTAGAFGDRHVPAWWITFAVIWKYILATVLLILPVLRGMPENVGRDTVFALAAVGVTRAAVLLGMMQCSQGSFWTTMRVMSDLPFALLFAVASVLVLPWVRVTSNNPQEGAQVGAA